jgi:hypothetical protein
MLETLKQNPFTLGYLLCMSFTGCSPNEPDPIENEYDFDLEDLADETLEQVAEDCERFQRENAVALERFTSNEYLDMQSAGHDFWLTRNGHGAGYWDRVSGDKFQDLCDASDTFGPLDLYRGDDGLIYGG